MTRTLYFNNGKVCHWQRVTVQLNIKLPNTACSHLETQISVRLLANAHFIHNHLALECKPMLVVVAITSLEQAEPTLRGCTVATGTIPLCLEQRTRDETRENSKEHCMHASNTVHKFSTLRPWERKTASSERMSTVSARQGLAGRSNWSLRRWCFINWAMLLRAELLTTLLWGLSVHKPQVSYSIKYSLNFLLKEAVAIVNW